jgi:hypothetical protein
LAEGVRRDVFYCKYNSLRCDIAVLPVWTAGGIRL